MKPILLGLVVLLFLVSSAAGQGIDLRQAQRLALEQNLNLQAQGYETRASNFMLRSTFGIYDPVAEAEVGAGGSREKLNSLFFRGAIADSDEPDNGVDGPLDLLDTEASYQFWDVSLSQLIPTGAELRLGFSNRREDITFIRPPPIDPAYDTTFSLTLVQPLLRNFGRTLTEQEIRFAVHDRNMAVSDLRESAFEILSAVRNAYFEVLRSRDEMNFRRTSVSLAERVLEENRARVDAGVLPPVEILEAEVGMKLREREFLDARSAYEDALDRLTLLLNASEQVQVVDDMLHRPPIQASEEEGFLSALERRPDLQRRREEIERLKFTERIGENRLLPEVNLRGAYSQSGLTERYGRTIEEAVTDDYRRWEVGVVFSYPLGNRLARNDLTRTRMLIKSQNARLAQLRDEVRREIRAAIRDLETNSLKIEVTDLGTKLARERLDSLLKRRDVGLATTRDVLEGEEDLAEARTLHIAALADYNRAVTEYLRTTGLLLEHEGITFTGNFAGEDRLLEIRSE